MNVDGLFVVVIVYGGKGVEVEVIRKEGRDVLLCID